jgi:predicted nucleotidyltransferase
MLIENRHLELVKKILSNYPYTFYAFGSRVSGKAKTFSDLDLFYLELIPKTLLQRLEEEFEESDLPFKVDLMHWKHCVPRWKESIIKHTYCLQGDPNLIDEPSRQKAS